MPPKKSAALSHLPPLVFVNSPVFQPAPVLTPDMAVDYPVTAKVVPFENLSESSWVSPQFRILHGCQSAQQNCQSMRQASTFAKQRLNKIRPDISLKSCKFKSLQFVGGNNDEPRIQTKPVSELKMCSASLEVGASSNTHHKIVEESRLSCAGIMNNITVHTPELIVQADSSSCLPDRNTDYNHLGAVNPTNRKTVETTPTRISHRDTIRQRLLKPHNLFCEGRYSDSDVDQQASNSKNCSNNMQTIKKLISSEMHIETILDVPDNIFVGGYEKNNLGTSNSNTISSLVSKNNPISDNSGPSPLRKIENTVLVVDTPVCDYGLTFRQRQLRCRSMLKN